MKCRRSSSNRAAASSAGIAKPTRTRSAGRRRTSARARRSGAFLRNATKPLTVAILAQNDDFGADFVEGLTAGIDRIRGRDRCRGELRADRHVGGYTGHRARRKRCGRVLRCDDVDPARDRVASEGAEPRVGCRRSSCRRPRRAWGSSSSSPVARPRNRNIYTTAFAKSPLDPAYAEDEQVTAFVEELGEYASATSRRSSPSACGHTASGDFWLPHSNGWRRRLVQD